jgi:hypothetical protein
MDLRRRAAALCGAAALLLVGCGGASMVAPPPDGSSGGAALVMGQLDAAGAFHQLADGTDVTLVEGAQGGFHVWMDFQAPSTPPMDATMLRTAHRLSDGALILRTQGPLNDMPLGGGGESWQLPAMVPMFMCPSPVGIAVIDTPVSFTIDLQGSDGSALGHGEVNLVAHCPTADPASASFCSRICNG